MRISKRAMIFGASGLAAAAALGWYFARPERLAVDLATVGVRPIESTIEAYGRTRVRERYVVVAPVAGRLERITRQEGSTVRAGEVVARLLPLPLDSETSIQARARIDAAAAIALAAAGQARVASAALLQRQRELARAARLVEAGAMAQRALEEAQLAVVDAQEQARGAAERSVAADAELRQVKAVVDARRQGALAAVAVRAPASGSVLRVPERSERIVAAGTPLMEVGDVRSLEVVADLLSSDVLSVSVGDPVRLRSMAEAGDENLSAVSGRVRAIEPSAFTKVSALGIEEQRVNVIVELNALPAGLTDGHRVSMAIIVWSSRGALAVPRSAVLAGAAEGQWIAYAVRGGRVERRDVRIGHLSGADAEVLSGLNGGDAVIVFPSDRVRDGARVEPRSGGT